MTNVMNNFDQIELEDMSDEEIVQYFTNYERIDEIDGLFDSYGNEIDPSKFSEEERAYWLERMDIDKKILSKAKEIVKSREVENEFSDMEYEANIREFEEMEKKEPDADGGYDMTEFVKNNKSPLNWMIEQGYIAINNGKYVKDIGGYLEKDPNPKVGMSLEFTQKYYDYIYKESLRRAVKRVLAEEKKK